MKSVIQEAIWHIQKSENIKVILAVEAGSRAWGFESPDSDYDVRYVYVRQPEDYLQIDMERDVIDHYHKQPYIQGTRFDDPLLDITGWDLRKTLQLMRKSNPQLQEWLNSPVTYWDLQKDELRELNGKIDRYAPVYAFYRDMAHSNFRTYLCGDYVRYKKYLYVIRPLLAAQWVVTYRTFPPVDFRTLFDTVIIQYEVMFPELRGAIEHLLIEKAKASEMQDAPRNEILHEWITSEFARKRHQMNDPESNPTDMLNEYFRRTVRGFSTLF
jgi:uncharacterized protein